MKTAFSPFPHCVPVEEIPVLGFPNCQSLFERVMMETRTTGQSLVYYLNVHVANMAHRMPRLKAILQQGDVVYCDGAGIVLGAKLLGQSLPTRLTAADWFMDMLGTFAAGNRSVFLLGGQPGVAEKTLEIANRTLPRHSIVGVHHGYISDDPGLEASVIDHINAAQPDILIVGFGTPLQELWIERNRERLQVPVIYAIGAVMDYIAGSAPRCPAWMGQNGLEWLYRLWVEPVRLFDRYVMGNPWFLSRMLLAAMQQRMPVPGRKMPIPQT